MSLNTNACPTKNERLQMIKKKLIAAKKHASYAHPLDMLEEEDVQYLIQQVEELETFKVYAVKTVVKYSEEADRLKKKYEGGTR